MKTFLPALFTLVLAFATAKADLTLTQQIQQDSGQAGAPKDMTMTFKIKGSMARIDMSPAVSTILNTQTGDAIALLNSQKMAMSVPASMMKAMSAKIAASKGAAATNTPSPVQATGNKQTINGFETEEYTTTMGDTKVSYWVAPNFPDKDSISEQYAKVSAQMNEQFPQAKEMKAVSDSLLKYGYPIRTVVQTPTTGTATITLVGVNKDPLPDSDFKVPSDFRTMQTPAIPQQ